MSDILKKFISSNSEKITQKDYNLALASGLDSPLSIDYNRPFTFLEWKAQNNSLKDESQKDAYQKYLERWYSNRFDKQTSNDIIKNQYKQLIERLQFVFKDDPSFKRLANVNLDDPYDVEVIIPLISKKLRDIAIYYVQQRANVKKSKIKYNIAGSNNALEKLFSEYILKSFTNSGYQTTVIEQSAFSVLPELSAIKDDFKIIIQELYDTNSYFDKKKTTEPKDSFFDDLGILNIETDNPLFSNFIDDVTAITNLALSSTINLDGIDSNKLLEIKATAKYLGTDLYYISGGFYAPKTDNLTIDIQTGNNTFYWPSGEFIYAGINDLVNYQELPINQSKLVQLGTAASNFEEADKIFVNRCGYGIKGAWLQKVGASLREDVFQTEIQGALKCEGRTLLRYPFPGRGYFIDGNWTGVSTNGLVNKTYFTEQELAELEKLYWNTTVSDVLSSSLPLYINDSFLIDNGAQPGKLYSYADHFWIRQTTNPNKIEDETPNGVFNNEIKDYWLYKFQKTELPIRAGAEQTAPPDIELGTHILWPYISYNLESFDPLAKFPINSYKIALTKTLSSLNVQKEFPAACAGDNQLNSDVILKLDECGNVRDAAFLKGQSINNFNSTSWGTQFIFPNNELSAFNYSLSSGFVQPGLVFKAKNGIVTPFIWQANGAKFGDINDVPPTKINELAAFCGVKHEPNCPYYAENISSLYYYKDEASKISKCSCKAINYSPLGHIGNRADSYDYLSDFIFEITNPRDLSSFSINDWIDSKGNNWLNSDRFAFFKLDKDNKNKDVGWGTGKWVTGTGADFLLRPGIVYGYYRNGRLACSANIDELYLIINHKYCDIKEYPALKDELCYSYDFVYDFSPQWVDLIPDQTKDISLWEAKPYNDSAMIFNPGDHLVYIHRNSNTFKIKWTGSFDTDENNQNNSTVQHELANFIWQSKLYGWDYSNNKWTGSPTAYGARPYWALADSICGANEFNLTLGTARTSALDYLFISQPKITIDVFNHFDTIEYFRRSENSFIWSQNFMLSSDSNESIWKEIKLTEKEPNIQQNCAAETEIQYKCYGLPANFQNDSSEGFATTANVFDTTLIVESLTADSDIILESSSLDQPVNVLYCAKNPFTFTQTLTDISVGIPPSGGLYVPITSGLLVKAEKPFANMLNINNPTIAIIEKEDLLKREDLGLFTPENIALNQFNGSEVELTTNIDNDYKDQVFEILDPNLYANNRGLSDTTRNALTIKSSNAANIKYPPTAGNKSGEVRHDKGFANFNGYSSSKQTIGNDSLSIPYNEQFDPWGGDEGTEWLDNVNYKPNLYGEYNILSGGDSWSSNIFAETTAMIHNIQSDVYGNYYILYKDDQGTIFENKDALGRLYVKNLNNQTLPAPSALSSVYGVYNNNATIYSQLTSNTIKNIEVFYDTMVLNLSSSVLINRITQNYETGEIFSNAEQIINSQSDASFSISLSSPIDIPQTSIITDDNLLIVSYMTSGTYIAIPSIYEHYLGSNEIKNAYDYTTDVETLSATLFDFRLTTFKSCKSAYDKDSEIYTMVLIASNEEGYSNAFFTLFFNFKRNNNKWQLISVNMIKPYLSKFQVVDFLLNDLDTFLLNDGDVLQVI